MEINLSTSRGLIVTDAKDILVDGDNFGWKTGDRCYLPVFKFVIDDPGNDKLINTWFFGSLFMSKYVVVYDNS